MAKIDLGENEKKNYYQRQLTNIGYNLKTQLIS